MCLTPKVKTTGSLPRGHVVREESLRKNYLKTGSHKPEDCRCLRNANMSHRPWQHRLVHKLGALPLCRGTKTRVDTSYLPEVCSKRHTSFLETY